MRRSRSKRPRPELNATINVTNMVDVMLTILLVFMIITPVLEHSLRLQLPEAGIKELSDPAQMTVEIARDRSLYVNEQPVQLDALVRVLSLNPHVAVNVKGDAGISYQDLMNVLDAVRAAGVKRIGLATEVKVDR
ncbi:MAG: biopolymer transporter ExbD [Verrucomicrobia bacterium]|nr:biopolymer transporter ExbD [Verrucomicrobiota bacterium]